MNQPFDPQITQYTAQYVGSGNETGTITVTKEDDDAHVSFYFGAVTVPDTKYRYGQYFYRRFVAGSWTQWNTVYDDYSNKSQGDNNMKGNPEQLASLTLDGSKYELMFCVNDASNSYSYKPNPNSGSMPNQITSYVITLEPPPH